MTIKKLFSKAAAVVLSVCLIGDATGFEPWEFAVGAAEEQVYGDFLYVDKGDYIEITGLIPETIEAIENAKEGDTWVDEFFLDIPEYIYDKPVTSIGNKAFYHDISDKGYYLSIGLPLMINNIENDAFYLNSSYLYFKAPCISPGETVKCSVVKTLYEYFERIYDYKTEYYGFNDKGEKCSQSMDTPFRLSTNEGNGGKESSVIYDPINETLTVDYDAPIYSDYSNYNGVNCNSPFNSIIPVCRVIDKSTLFELFYDNTQEFGQGLYFNQLSTILDETKSTTYNPKLANMLCVLSQSAYNRSLARFNYWKLGFNSIEFKDYDTTYDQADNCGYVIGYQDLEDGTREFLITVRGTASDILTEFYKPPCGDPAEWFSDFNMGFSQLEFFGDYPKYHNGFYVAAQRIWESLKKYNNGTIRTDKVRYVLTGHSRGAAVSNLVSHALMEAGVKKSAMYSYNFACPDVAIGDDSHFLDAGMNSIFNLNCARDLVGQVPGSAGTYLSRSAFRALIGDIKYWGKFGRTYFWDVDWESSLPANVLGLVDYHPCDTNYIPYFSWEYPLSDFKTYAEMKSIQNSNIMDWSTPIKVVHATIRPQPTYISAYAFEETTVKITDKDGKVVGTVKDNSVSIESGYEDKIQTTFTGDSVDIAIDADSGYQISVESEAPATIAVSQENAAYNSVNNGAVYTAQPGNTTIDITPDTPAAETPVTDDSGKAIEPDKVWNLGDVNGDKSANIADAVLLQKWLLNKPDSDLTEWTAADIYEDGKLNVYDLTLLKQLITE